MPGRNPVSRSGEALARFFEGSAEFGEREFAHDSRGQRIAQIEAAGADSTLKCNDVMTRV
jgi:hypothetical protein